MTQKSTLESHFSKYGKLVKVTMPLARTMQKHCGFAFVAFETSTAMKKALSEDHEVGGEEYKEYKLLYISKA